MTDGGAGSAEQIRSQIEQRLGFLPPFFAPALTNPAVLESLWQQTVHSYLDSTLPPLLFERLFAVLARYCDLPYSAVCHGFALRTMGCDAEAISNLLDGPHVLPDADEAVKVLGSAPAEMQGWAEAVPVAESVLRAAVSMYLHDGDRHRLTPALRRVVPVGDLDQLVLFLGYVSACLRWAEAHPELSFEADNRAISHVGPPLAQASQLGDFSARVSHLSAEPTGGNVWPGNAGDADPRFFLTFDHAPIGMALTDLDGRFLRVNRALCRLVGYDETTLTTMSCYDITHPDYEALYRQNVERLIAGNTPSFQMDKRYRHAGGAYLWIRQSVALLRAGDGTPHHLISHTEDITELREHSEQLAAANTELQRSNRDLLQFSAVAAHDLKGPLAAIVGCADLLCHDLPIDNPAEDRELVERIAAAGTRMGKLVDDLLSLAQVGSERLQVQWISLDDLLATLLADLRESIDTAGARIHVEILGGVWAHPAHLRQVFTNLITNAIKYTAAGSHSILDISVVAQDEDIVCTVADNGIGVPVDAVDSIFTMYHRENADTAAGTGVGLAICQRIIERHGGSIWVENRPGGGSLFRFRLPRFPAELSPVTTDMPAHPGARRTQATFIEARQN